MFYLENNLEIFLRRMVLQGLEQNIREAVQDIVQQGKTAM